MFNMKFITDYKEFDTGRECLGNFISDIPLPEKGRILCYLKSGKNDGVRCSCIMDYVTGTLTGEGVSLYTDGEYYWDDEEIYHFERYNLKLQSDFLEKVCIKKFPNKL